MVVRFRAVEVWFFDGVGVGVVGALVPRRPRLLRVVRGVEMVPVKWQSMPVIQ